MNTFKQRVIDTLRAQNWNIKYTTIPFIDFFSVRSKSKGRKAYRVEAHGHLSQKERDALCEYGKRTGIHVIYVHEATGREIEFIRLFPRYEVITPDPYHSLYGEEPGEGI